MPETLPIRAWLATVAGVIILSFPGQKLSSAQSLSEYQVKAAYVYNFAKFVAWPTQAFSRPTAPIVFCVLSDPAFESELNRMVKEKTISGRRAEVVSVRNAQESRSCHVLFINAAQARQVRRVLNLLQGTSILTVSETPGFIEAGGIVNFVLQDDRVRFQINHKAAMQAGLQISSRLLSLANLVVE